MIWLKIQFIIVWCHTRENHYSEGFMLKSISIAGLGIALALSANLGLSKCKNPQLMGQPKFSPYSTLKGKKYEGRSWDLVEAFLDKNGIEHTTSKLKGSKEYMLKKFYKSANNIFVAYPSYLPEEFDIVLSKPTDYVKLHILMKRNHKFKFSLPYSLQNKRGAIYKKRDLEKYMDYKDRSYLKLERFTDLKPVLDKLRNRDIDYIILESRTLRNVMNVKKNSNSFYVAPTPLVSFTLHLAMHKSSDCAEMILSKHENMAVMRKEERQKGKNRRSKA